MIYSVRGNLILMDAGFAVVECGGVGYRVQTSITTQKQLKLNTETMLYTYMNVREDAMELYGFASKGELSTFKMLIGITGVAITATQSEVYNLPRGIVVYTIDKGGPCDNTDLKAEDIITKLDGTKITSFADIYSELEEHKAGDKVKLGFYRQSDGKDYEIEITLQEDKK